MTQRHSLEVLRAGPDGHAAGAPLVFVHGAFCGAWIWSEHFLPFFAERGHAVHALSLRGHGGSAGHEDLFMASMEDYLDDLRSVVDSLDRPPVLIGHSMGGMVIQRFVERFDRTAFRKAPAVAGIALLAALPPGGLAATALQLLLFDPLVFWQLAALQTFGEHAVTVDGVHRAMFANTAPKSLTLRYLPRMQAESYRIQLDLVFGAPPNPVNARAIPRLVLGGSDDPFVPPWMARLTAHHYDTEAVILNGVGHAMMLGPNWRAAADALAAWLEDNGL